MDFAGLQGEGDPERTPSAGHQPGATDSAKDLYGAGKDVQGLGFVCIAARAKQFEGFGEALRSATTRSRCPGGSGLGC